jgi:DNA-binding SARP family transcriptional activator/predicted ATPase
MVGLQLSLLGPFEATIDGRPVAGFATDKVRALLAYLALAPDQAHDRLALATLLWSEQPDAAALGNLRKSLSRLRQTLDAASPGFGDRCLDASRQAVRLRGEAVTSDVAALKAGLAASETHPHAELHTCRECLEGLETAVAGYRGELLGGLVLADAGVFEEWLAIEREACHEALMTALHRLADAYLRRGEPDRAAQHAARRLALEPWNEEAHRQMMAALAVAGRRSEALAQYALCRDVLARELGAAPSPETTALYEQLRDAAPAPGEPAGRSRLRHFPPQYTPFVGREDALITLQAQLLDPSCRLLTLVGPGGAGKTRLAVQAAERLAETLDSGAGPAAGVAPRDGIVFVNLASVESVDLVPAAIAAALGLTFRSAADPRAQLLSYLADKSLLLVLDNVEQLAGTADLVAALLDAAPDVRLLVTSRIPLRIRAERRLAVGGLDYPGAGGEPAAKVGFDAVRLFTQAAGHFRPDLTLGAADLAAVAEICRLVDGMPLALEIAASWLYVHDCATIAAEIARSQRFLVSRLEDTADRQQSMAAVFDHSWVLLSPPERAVLAGCSVFQDAFDFDAASAVTLARAEDLARLVEQGLVQRSAGGRFALHALAREFAAEQLAIGGPELDPLETVAARHGETFLGRVAALEPVLYGLAPQQGLARMQAMLPDVRRAWAWAVAHDRLDVVAASLDALSRCYLLVGLFDEAVRVFGDARRQLLARAGADGAPEPARSALACRLAAAEAAFLASIGRYAEANEAANAALALAEALGVPALGARARHELSQTLLLSGEYDAARRTQREAVELAAAAGNERLIVETRTRLAIIHFRTDAPAEALAQLEDVLPRAQALGDTVLIANTHGNLSVCHIMLDHTDQALAHNKAALRAFQDMGFQAHVAVQLGNLGILRFRLGDNSGAQTCLEQALAIDESLGNRPAVARHAANLGHLYRRLGEPARALEHYGRALALTDDLAGRSFMHSLLIDKAEALFDLADYHGAREVNDTGLAYMIELGHPEHVLQGRILAARIDDALGDRAAAVGSLRHLLDPDGAASGQAALHYELWRLGAGDEHARAAAALYRGQPFYDAKVRLEALRAAGLA